MSFSIELRQMLPGVGGVGPEPAKRLRSEHDRNFLQWAHIGKGCMVHMKGTQEACIRKEATALLQFLESAKAASISLEQSMSGITFKQRCIEAKHPRMALGTVRIDLESMGSSRPV